MHKCRYEDRIELKNGKITRIVRAFYNSNKYSNELDVLKQTEDNINYCRNIYFQSIFGYGVVFKNEYISNSCYSYYSNSFLNKIEPYGKTALNGKKELPLYCANLATDEDLKIITNKYPNFSYLLNKWICRDLSKIIKVLSIWKSYPQIELLLANGFESVAFSKSFYRLSDKKRKSFLSFLKNNRNEIIHYNLSYNEILSCLKNCITPKDFILYKNGEKYGLSEKEVNYCSNEIDFFKYQNYLTKCNLLNISLDDDYWHFPKNLDESINKLEVIKKNIEIQEKIEIQNKYSQKIKHLDKYKENINGFDFFIPQSIKEIEIQAKELNQCLITCNYPKKVIDGLCVLVFIQKNGIPVATAELFKNNKIGQFYANEKNRKNLLPTEDVKNSFFQFIKNKDSFLISA